jgi:hypothetical protein
MVRFIPKGHAYRESSIGPGSKGDRDCHGRAAQPAPRGEFQSSMTSHHERWPGRLQFDPLELLPLLDRSI